MKVGRNDPCPCGSGKKFKKCCLVKQSPQVVSEILYLDKEKDREALIQKTEQGIIRDAIKAKYFHLNFRPRNTHLPRTFFLFKNQNGYFLLFWLEYGSDNSVYVWFDDDPNESWEVVGKHTQTSLNGQQEVTFDTKPYNVFDPHISWHPSGQCHVRGYSSAGERREVVVEAKRSSDLTSLEQGKTIPLSALVFPVMNSEKTLKWFGHGITEFSQANNSITILDRDGLTVFNNGAEKEAFFILDSVLVPKDMSVVFDIGMVYEDVTPGLPPISNPLYPRVIITKKQSNKVGTYFRLYLAPTKIEAQNSQRIVANLFNKESIDLFQLKKPE